MIVEICASSFLSARNAQQAGADRIELCTELGVGGITPSYGLIRKVTEELDIPVHVLIRPRSGSFCYDRDEFDIMKRDIVFCREAGCSGIVSGVLTADNELDVERTKELKELAGPLIFTFHRAIDWVSDPLEIADKLKEIGVNRILTSGQKATAALGMDTLVRLMEHCGGRPVIMPGGGINADNVLDFVRNGFTEIHFSATTLQRVLDQTPEISMNSPRFLDETNVTVSDGEKIETIISRIRREA
ncbi:copper homeostasis protein CutC [Sinomicrobium weinanense]|uniref:PF03932 family protein CutC n=1 Tax=Sinomicrobium weinanense TaxID=2842200 RepID=A0A926Q4A4_9FLAO|nr:copper homeostasis protein CutC [Sinomicrobium weinanense]MBC9796871.1 copper homeostasis protein CutC [Sinomicrobium weinanense]MBU3123878.1 copper homeostasis protein CutC [Sinomicrobium weinanense]